MVALIDSTALWYLTRGTGIAALLLLTVSVAVGVLDSARWSTNTYSRTVVAGVHRFASLLVVIFVALHVVTSVVDGFAPIGWIDVFVPLHARYRSVWLGFGALAFDLVLALVATSLLRKQVGARVWRLVHWLAYACWPVALLHALGTGSDVRDGWTVAIGTLCLAATAGALAVRVGRARDAVARIGLTAAMVVVIVGVEVWTLAGPMQHGWARRAGTPRNLLAPQARPVRATPPSGPARRVAPTTTTVARTLPVPPFAARISGTIQESAPNSQGAVQLVIAGTMRDGAAGNFTVSIVGTRTNGGLRITTSSVAITAPGGADAHVGRTIGVNGSDIDTAVRGADGRAMQVLFRLTIARSGTVSGVVQARPISWNG